MPFGPIPGGMNYKQPGAGAPAGPAGGITPTGTPNPLANWNFGGQAAPSPAPSFGIPQGGGGGAINTGGQYNFGGPPPTLPPNTSIPTPPSGTNPNPNPGAGGINTSGLPIPGGGVQGQPTGEASGPALGPNATPPKTTPQGGMFNDADSFTRFAKEYGPPTAFGGGTGTYEKFAQMWGEKFPGAQMPTNEQWEAGDFDVPGIDGGVAEGWTRGWGTSPGHPGEGVSASPDALWGQLEGLQGAGINVPFDQSQMGAGGTYVGDTDTQQEAMRAFLSGPLFSDMPYGSGLPLNLQLGQTMQQGDRSAESEQILRNLAQQGEQGGANQLMQQMMGDFQNFSSPESMDALRAQEENQARAGVASSQNSAMNQMRDFGIAGQGQAARSPVAQMSNLGNRQLQDQMLKIAQNDEARRMGRFQMGGQLATQGAGAYQQLQAAPQQMLASRMEMAQNPALSGLIESLYQQSNLAAGKEFTRGNDPNPASLIGAGALSGAAAGTAALPGWGTAIGAIGGAGLGAYQAYGNR